MSATPSIQDLVAINLRFDAGSSALNVRALAQLVAKLLFAGGRAASLRPEDLGKSAGKVLKVPRIAPRAIGTALQFLNEKKLAKESAGKWLLTDLGHQEIQADVSKAAARLDGILARHFPGSLDRDILLTWFRDACVAFYGLYGTQWAATLGGKPPGQSITRRVVETLLVEVTNNAGLRSGGQALSDGFYAFLDGRHTDDVEHQWSLGQALLAARLVAANIGPDPLAASDFRDSVLLLDTNALLVAALEAHPLAWPLAALGAALASLHVQAGYTEETRDEYIRAVDHTRSETIALLDRIPLGLLRDSGDPFVDTARERLCTSASDFARFFEQLLDPPAYLSDTLPIQLFADPSIKDSARKGAGDEKLKRDIVAMRQSQRRRPKTPRAVEHDAALTTVAENLRAGGQRCVVLTLDRTMHELSLARAGPHAPPAWVSLDALIQVLAVDGAGPNVDPASFAPLMSSIIRHQCEPSLNTYSPEDLGILLDIEQRCVSLPPDEVRSIAATVARARLAGRKRDDPELQLLVRRAFLRGHVDENVILQKKLETSKVELDRLERQLIRGARREQAGRAVFIANRAPQIRLTACLRHSLLLARTAISVVLLSVLGLAVARKLVPSGSGVEFVGLLLPFPILALTFAVPSVAKTYSDWRRAIDTAESRAQEEYDSAEVAAVNVD